MKGDLEGMRLILLSQPLAVLATSGEEGPYTSLVAFACSDDLREMVFVTTRSSRKYANILRSPEVALLVDDRQNRVADFRDASAVTVLGTVGEGNGEHREMFLDKHPHLCEFVEAPTTAVLRVRVRSLLMVTRFQRVKVVEFDD